MAVDIKIERFAIDLFRQFWKVIGFESFILDRPKDYGEETKYITTSVIHAVGCRYTFFMGYLRDFFLENYDQYSKNGIDFYYFIHKYARAKFGTFDYLNIFDRLFLTSAFIVRMCDNCVTKNNDIYRYVGPLCWAMYFETEFKDEFYDAGGWDELTKYAKKYDAELLKQEYLDSVSLEYIYYYFYQKLELNYNFDKVINHFKQRSSIDKDWFCCFKCLPLHHILYIWSYSLVPASYAINTFCNEGLLQLFFRMMSSEEMNDITNKIPEDEIKSDKKSDSKVLVTKAPSSVNTVADIKDIAAEELCKRLFADLGSSNSEELNHTQNHGYCIFCHINLDKTPDQYFNPRVDSYKVDEVKNFICQTVFKSKSFETVKRETFVDESVSSDETKTLRLFLTIGMKSAIQRMLANFKKEAKFTNVEDLKKVSNLKKSLYIESDLTENASKVKNEKRKKRNKRSV